MAYALKVITESDRSSLGHCYFSEAANQDSDINKEMVKNKNTKDHAEQYDCTEFGNASDSSYAPTSSELSSSESEESMEEYGYNYDEASVSLDTPTTVEPQNVLSFESTQQFHNLKSMSSSMPTTSMNNELLAFVPVVVNYCVTHHTRVMMEESAFVAFRDIMLQQLELSFLGMPR